MSRRDTLKRDCPDDVRLFSYIVFRAADVKDLKIEQNAPVVSQPPTMPEDPAIMSVSTGPNQRKEMIQ